MNKRTRVEHAIKHLPVDQVPCAELIINDKLIQTVAGRAAVGFAERLAFVDALGLDAICLQPVCNSALPSVPVAGEVVFDDIHDWVNSDLFTFAVLDGPMGWSGKILGFEQMLMQMARSTPAFCELVAAVETLNIALIERLAASGINGILLADDIAYNQGVIARPALLRKLIFPSLTAQVESAHKLGLPVFFHSDGNLTMMLEDVVDAGFDGLQCIEKLAGMNIGEVKRQYGARLCLWGNLDPAELIEPRSVSQLEQTVTQIVKAAGGNSGLIFGTSSGLFENMRLENVKAVYEIAKRQTVC
ncbi:MAG: hemE 10 [Firmicutes bacterium]|nr:hemE 10 [Bacillota bacterium]